MRKMIVFIGLLLFMTGNVMAANSCLTFDGTNDWVNTVSGALIPTSGDFTVECWAKCESDPGTYTEMLSQGSSGNAFYIGPDYMKETFGWGTPGPAQASRCAVAGG